MADERMFVGVEVMNAQQGAIPAQLEPFAFELQRHLKHLHIGPCQALPQKWKDLKTELAARGEIIMFPSLEVYGHHCEDPSKAETMILIGLAKPAP
jgi:hypothetical protein